MRYLGAKGPIQMLMGWVGGAIFLTLGMQADLFDDVATPRGFAATALALLPFVLFLRLPGPPVIAALTLVAAMVWSYSMYSGDPDGLGAVALLAIPAAGYVIVVGTWLFHLAYLSARTGIGDDAPRSEESYGAGESP